MKHRAVSYSILNGPDGKIMSYICMYVLHMDCTSTCVPHSSLSLTLLLLITNYSTVDILLCGISTLLMYICLIFFSHPRVRGFEMEQRENSVPNKKNKKSLLLELCWSFSDFLFLLFSLRSKLYSYHIYVCKYIVDALNAFAHFSKSLILVSMVRSEKRKYAQTRFRSSSPAPSVQISRVRFMIARPF